MSRLKLPRGRKVFITAMATSLLTTMVWPGCRHTPPPPSIDDEVDACCDKFSQVQRSLTLIRQSRRAMAHNVGTHSASLQRQRRQNEAVGLNNKIPSTKEHDPAKLKTAIMGSAKQSAVVIRDIEVGVATPPKRKLPRESNAPYQWSKDDLISSYAVEFFVESLTERRFAEWYRMLPVRLERMLIVSEVSSLPGGHRIRGSAYAFRDVSPPLHRLEPIDMNTQFKNAGLNVNGCPDSAERLAKLQALIDDIAAVESIAMETLQTLAKVRLQGAQFNLFESLRRSQAEQSERAYKRR